jgi:flagellar hook assembly protein FlgD
VPVATPQTERTRNVALVMFGVLVVLTVGAFFVAQRLKRAKPAIRHVHLPYWISPNGDDRKDTARIGFRLPKPDHVTVSIVDAGGDEIRRLLDDRKLSKGRHRFVWNGRDASAAVPPDGFYFLRVTLRDEGRATTAPRGIHLVTKEPRPKLVSVSPSRIAARGSRRIAIRFEGPARQPPVFSIYRTGAGERPRLVARHAGMRGRTVGAWDGRDRRGRLVPPGTYAVAVTVQNRARVAGSAPRDLPPAAPAAAPRTGVTISGPQAAGPLEPVRAGTAVHVSLSGVTGRVRYRLVRAGATRAVARGRANAPALRVPIPRRAATGLYLVRVRAPAGRVAVPLVVRGRRRAAQRHRVLVVLPTMAWQGANPVDDDADGFPDTLDGSPSVGVGRPFALGRPPRALGRETTPLMQLLDSEGVGYDITTDLALARGHGPHTGSHTGVLFAGSELWLTERLDAELRSFVEAGGRVASFGTDAFRRTVRLTPTALTDPSPPQRANVFGEQTAPTSSAAAPLVVNRDTLGLFAGSDGFIGLFTRFEQQQALVSGARVLSGAGRDPKHPAFVAYRLGRGTVVRVGTPQWARATATDTEVAAVTRTVWDLLSR